MTVATATFDWAEEQSRHHEELIRIAKRESAQGAWHEEKAVRESDAILNWLRGDDGRGFVSRLEIDFREFIDEGEPFQRRVSDCAHMRERLPSVPTDELEQAASNLAKFEAELQTARARRQEMATRMWNDACWLLSVDIKWITILRTGLPSISQDRFTQVNWEIVSELEGIVDRLRALLRTAIVAGIEWRESTVPPRLAAEVWTIRISPLAYLRAMVNLFWSAIRHPLSDTTIDLSTGRVLYRT